MASTKEYRDFILEQPADIPDITCRPMMGEFLLYSNGMLFGGIYDDHLLVKKVPENAKFKMEEVLPYDGAKTPMYLIEDVGNREKLLEIIARTCDGMTKQNGHFSLSNLFSTSKKPNGRILTAKSIEVEPYPWLNFLEKSSKK